MNWLAWIFTAYASHLANGVPTVESRSVRAAMSVSLVLEQNESLFPAEGWWGDLKTGLFLLKIAHHESRFDERAKNSSGDCGIGQVASSMAFTMGSSCTRMQQDIMESFRVSLLVLKEAKKDCGSAWVSIASAYASGRCNGAQSIARDLIPLVVP